MKLEIQKDFVIIEISLFPLVSRRSITFVSRDTSWNILNYSWGFFWNKFEIFSYRVILNNISDKNSRSFYSYIKINELYYSQ